MFILIRCTGPLKKRLVSDGKLYSENVNCFVYFGPQCIPLMLDIPGTYTVEAKILGKPILFYFYGSLTCDRFADHLIYCKS